jgi:hypothetical protein
MPDVFPVLTGNTLLLASRHQEAGESATARGLRMVTAP